MSEPTADVTRMPTVYLSHGAPPLADDATWTRELASWSEALPKPSAVLVVSAHWEEAPLAVGATRTVPLTYDFWGFPQHYYDVTYPAPGAPALADDVRKLLADPRNPVVDVPDRGLDHGAYVPLVEMFPAADVPVLQISMPTLDPVQLLQIGRALAPLRDQGVLIMGSGFTTHNLSRMSWQAGPTAPAPSWSTEFDAWVQESVTGNDIDALLDFTHRGPAAQIAHPRTEHFAPLFVTLGAGLDAGDTGRTVVDGFWYGLSKRSFQLG